MKIIFFLFFSSLVLFISCNDFSKKHISQPEKSISPIRLNINDANSSNFIVDDLIELKEIIPLDKGSKFLISDIRKCIRKDSLIIILEQTFSKLLVFNNKGGFLNEIGKLGNGVGEFENIADFFIDENNLINIYSSESMKLILFDEQGKFISEKKIPFYARYVNKINSNKYAFYVDYNTSKYNEYCNLLLTDSLFNI